MNTLIIFQNEPGNFITTQIYDGTPPFPKSITLNEKSFELFIYKHNEKNYLIASEETIEDYFIEEAINKLDPPPLI